MIAIGLGIHFPSSFSTGTTSLMRPMNSALCALHISQRTPLSMARENPTYSGRKSVEPPSGAEPCLGPAWPNCAVSTAIVKSQAIPISWPPARRIPFTRLMTGLSQRRMTSIMSLNSRMYCLYSCGLPA